MNKQTCKNCGITTDSEYCSQSCMEVRLIQLWQEYWSLRRKIMQGRRRYG